MEPREAAQRLIELRFERADRDESAVGAFVGAVERRAAVEQIRTAALLPLSAGEQREEDRQQARGAVAHGAIDHLPAAGSLRLDQRGEHADHEIERTAAVVADEVERRNGLFLGPDRAQRARECDVIDVVPGRLGERPGLAPARHPAVDEARVARQHRIGAKPQALHDTRPKTFDQRVGGIEQLRCGLGAVLLLEVEHEGAPAAAGHVALVWLRRTGPVDAHHVRAHVGEQHGGERPRPDPGKLHDAQSAERPAAAVT